MRTPSGKIRLYCKGAVSICLSLWQQRAVRCSGPELRLSQNSDNIYTRPHLSMFIFRCLFIRFILSKKIVACHLVLVFFLNWTHAQEFLHISKVLVCVRETSVRIGRDGWRLSCVLTKEGDVFLPSKKKNPQLLCNVSTGRNVEMLL